MVNAEDILRQKGAVVFSVQPAALAYEAVEKMVKHNIGALLVVGDDGRLQGIVTERDYLKRLAVCGKSLHTTAVEEIMSRELVTVEPATDLGHCMALMTGRRIRHLPVVDARGLIGIVSIGDLVKAKLREQDAQIQHLTDYIQGAPSASYVG